MSHDWYRRHEPLPMRRRPEDTIAEDLLKPVLEQRLKFYMTRRDLAYFAQVSPRFLYDLENGKTTIQLRKLVAVGGHLNMRLTWDIGPRFNHR